MIGAGPAGAASAYLLAKRGRRVLLLERSAWPREKVCGGCLSASAVDCLRNIGLAQILLHATPVTANVIHAGLKAVRLPGESVYAIARDRLDAGLVSAFESIGGTFVSGASASVLQQGDEPLTRRVRVLFQGETLELSGRLVLACDGLGGSSVSNQPWAAWSVAPDAYLGVGATISGEAFDLAPHEVHMHLGKGGYVGAVRYVTGNIHLAAALDPRTVRATGGPASLVGTILRSCGRDFDETALQFKGAPTLTRCRAHLGGHRVLAVGDSCGYVEPFTGEGIAWALRSAIEVTRLLPDEWEADVPTRWEAAHARSLRTKQVLCRAVRFTVRRPLLAGAALELLRRAPSLARFITRPSEVST